MERNTAKAPRQSSKKKLRIKWYIRCYLLHWMVTSPLMPTVFTGEGWQDFAWHSHPSTKAVSGSQPACRINAGRGSGDVDSSLGTVKPSLLPLGHRLRCTWPGRSHLMRWMWWALFCLLTTVDIDSVILPAQDCTQDVQRLAGSAGTHHFNTTIFDVPQGS